MPFAHPPSGRILALSLLIILVAIGHESVRCEPDEDLREDEIIRPDGVHILDGSYVLDVGELRVNITNHGLIGSQYTANFPFSNAPSGEWPGGSGHEYLWGAGLWVGGKIQGQPVVSTGQPEREFRPGPGIFDTMYEAKNDKVTRPWPLAVPTGHRLPHSRADDDNDGKYDEDFLNGIDDDHDGQVDEDFGQIGDQMFTCTMYDNLPLIQELYPSHQPLGLKVVQRAACWFDEEYENIVALDFEITHVGFETLQGVYLGFFVDPEIQPRSAPSSSPDDLTGYYSGVVYSDRDRRFHRLQVAWARDAAPVDRLPGWLGGVFIDHTTDFRNKTAPHITGVRTYQSFYTSAGIGQGGEPLTDMERYYVMS